VLADGYAFNPPDIIEGRDVGIFDPNIDALVECPQDTLQLTISGGYTVNVQWYNNFKPIPGATNPEYDVTKKGSYTVCGAQEHYHHIALEEVRRLDIQWSGDEIKYYDAIKIIADQNNIELPVFIKKIIEDKAKRK
jgi:hypothetical protein